MRSCRCNKSVKAKGGAECFNFSMVAIGTAVAAISAIYAYTQNSPTSNILYYSFCLFVAAIVPAVFGFLLYIAVTSKSMCVCKCNEKHLAHAASILFDNSIFSFLTFLVIGFVIIPLALLNIYFSLSLITFMFILIISALLLVGFLYRVKLKSDTDNESLLTFLLFIVLYIAVFFLIINPGYPLFQGHVEIEAENIHYKSDAPIPVSIQVTGPNANIAIKLSQLKSNNIVPVESLQLELHNNTINSNRILIGNVLGAGKYAVFINTTNLDVGYYELNVKRKKYSGSIASFYLVDNTQLPANDQVANVTNV